VFTLIVQNSVPIARLGTATSNLTFFQQVGGTVGLAITGTIFGETFLKEVPRQLTAAGVPPEFANAFASSGGSALNSLTDVGDLGAAILAQVPEQLRPQVEPIIPAIVDAIHEAISLATAATFVIGIGTALIAVLIVVALLPDGKSREPVAADSLRAGRPEFGPSAD
jgi:hypothetical protein